MQERKNELAYENAYSSSPARGRSAGRAALSCTGGRAPPRGADWGLRANRDSSLAFAHLRANPTRMRPNPAGGVEGVNYF
jgi:hypothetical protein